MSEVNFVIIYPTTPLMEKVCSVDTTKFSNMTLGDSANIEGI